MIDIAALVADNLDIWTSAIERKSGAGRSGGGKRINLYGIDRLRALILDLAVRGKLVPRDARDEAAGELLKRIDAARAKHFPKLKKSPHPAASQADCEVPEGWEIIRLDRIANSQAGFAFKSKGFNEVGSGMPLVRIRDVGQPFTGTYYDGEYRDEFVVVKGDYLISMDGEFRVATWPGPDALLNQRVSRLQFFGDWCAKSFVAMALQIELAKLQGIKAYTTVDHLSGKQIAEAKIPLPPLAEQRRIVAKVDELMALCDALERESADALAAHQVLVETLLATLVNSDDAAALAASWARLESHFDTLLTTEASIEALKQTILDLAVRGKLVKQDAGDWPVEPLGKYVKEAVAGWSPKCIETPRSGDNWGVLKVSAVTWGRFQPEENKELPPSLEPRPEIEVAPGDFLISRANTAELVARSVVVPLNAPKKLMMSDKIIRFRFNDKIDPEYVNLVHASPFARAYYARVAGGTSSSMKNVSQAQIRALEIPIPPLAEQHRIVAKVDELMALCDALKARISDAAETRRHLADAIVERAAA